jgi:bifunctional DNase/RNase
MSKLKRERPLTHDLCKTLITGMGGSLRRIQITKVENRTYYAELHIRMDDRMIHIDARPSDSIAIALRFAAPIFAKDDLLTSLLFDDSSDESDAIPSTPEPEQSDQMTPAQLQKYLENLRPEDLGKFNI